MTIEQLHDITTALIAKKMGGLPVMVNTATFEESENGTIFAADVAGVIRVQGADDSGPTGRKHPMFVIGGPIEWHQHGDPI